MIDDEAPEADTLEQVEPLPDEAAPVDIEAPEADAAEQHVPATRGGPTLDALLPYDADEADAADQSRVVELDEDDYR